MFNKKAFRDLVTLRGKTYHDVAEYLDIDDSTLYRKMNGSSDFTRKEIQDICDYLSADPMVIFFDGIIA